ncbi:MAG: hypothetical protein IPM69_16935 [Ignavibacteria bacterium]|nr:hypothetical protein [Ignavibacteria bacterium]
MIQFILHVFILICIVISPLLAQQIHPKDANNWYFGERSGITFQGDTTTALSDGVLISGEGCATMSDRGTGELLFYTDGVSIWNKNHQMIATGLLGGSSSTQNVLIVPDPGNNKQYYIFTVPDLTGGDVTVTGMYYSILSLQNSDGRLITKNVFLIDSTAEKLTGSLDCAGDGFWVVSHHRYQNVFYSFHVSAQGVSQVPILSPYPGERRNHTQGFIKISPNRSKLAIASYRAGSFFSLFNFNAQNGRITNQILLTNPLDSKNLYYGASFSPDNTKLYASTYSPVDSSTYLADIFQYEVHSDSATVRNSLVQLGLGLSTQDFLAMQLAPDGKLYIASFLRPYLDAIDFPNQKGSECGYHADAIGLYGKSLLGLPNFMDYIFNTGRLNVGGCAGFGLTKSATGCVGSSLTFTDFSKTMPLSRRWEFEKGIPSFSTDSIVKVKYSQAGYYQVILIVENEEGVMDTSFTTAQVLPIPKANAGENKVICTGNSTQLGTTHQPGYYYSWYPTTGLNDPTIANPIATPTQSVEYTLSVANTLDCWDTDAVTVTVGPIKAVVSTDTILCRGSAVQLSASGGSEYLWTPATGLSNPTISNPIAAPNTSTRYKVLVSSGNCIDSATVNVVVKFPPKADAGTNQTICPGGSVKIGSRPVFLTTYQWTPTIGLDNPTSANPTASPEKTTTYTVVVTQSGCSDSSRVTVEVQSIPTAIAGDDYTICLGSSAQLGVSAAPGYTYLWSPTDGLNDRSLSNPIATPTNTTTYILQVMSAAGCVDYDTVIVTIGNQVTALVSSDTAVCIGGSVRLAASGGTNYKWFPSDGLDNSTSSSPIASPTHDMIYTVVVSSGYCTDSASVRVTLLTPPIADAGKDTTICKGEIAEIGTTAISGNTYSWSPVNDLKSPNASKTLATPFVPTTYILTVHSADGCVNYDTVYVGRKNLTERSFTLQPDMVIILPGEPFHVNLHTPENVSSWRLVLSYNSLMMNYKSITWLSNGMTASVIDLKDRLLITGTGANGDVTLNFDAFLPHTTDTIYPMKLTVDTAVTQPCEGVNGIGNALMLGEYCGKSVRIVGATGERYYLTVKDKSIDFGVGLSGNVRLEVFDYVGNSVFLITDGYLNAGAYSAMLDLPVGVYYCRMRAGMYESVRKVLIAR